MAKGVRSEKELLLMLFSKLLKEIRREKMKKIGERIKKSRK